MLGKSSTWKYSYFRIHKFPFKTVKDRWKEVPMSKTSSICSVYRQNTDLWCTDILFKQMFPSWNSTKERLNEKVNSLTPIQYTVSNLKESVQAISVTRSYSQHCNLDIVFTAPISALVLNMQWQNVYRKKHSCGNGSYRNLSTWQKGE